MLKLYSDHQLLCDRRDANIQIISINETAGLTYRRIPGVCRLYFWRAKRN